ncbi:MAG: TlpA disulfide reductase family protein [Bacteroidota bacterium]
MKKIFLIALSITMLSCSKEEVKTIDYAVFSGKIENPDGGKLSIVDNYNNSVKDISVEEGGIFTDTIPGIKQGPYMFKYANEYSDIYLKPGDNLNLTLDSKEFDETIKYSGNGSAENNYLAQVSLNQEKLGKLRQYQYLGTLEEEDFVKKMDSIKQLQTDFLNSQEGLDPTFKKQQEAEILYKRIYYLGNFEAFKNYVNKDSGFKVSENYPKYEEGLNLEDEKIIDVRFYKEYLKKYYSLKSAEITKSDSINPETAYLTIVSSEVKSSVIKEALLYGDAKYGISYTNDLQAYYDVFMANSTDEEHKKEITEKYNKLMKLSKGAPSPKFTDYENYAGGTTSLDDLKGKYVYIDVWATWCGPCKREIPSLKEVTKNYEGKNIAFVSMSVDKKKDYDKWRKMVEEKELDGYQLFAPNDWESDFVSDYEIMGIPRFILIDPEGNIVNANAPRPSSKELINLLNELSI